MTEPEDRSTPTADMSAFMQALMNALQKYDDAGSGLISCVDSVHDLMTGSVPVKFGRLSEDPREVLRGRNSVGECVEKRLAALLKLLDENRSL